jgi:hypothetical protein
LLRTCAMAAAPVAALAAMIPPTVPSNSIAASSRQENVPHGCESEQRCAVAGQFSVNSREALNRVTNFGCSHRVKKEGGFEVREESFHGPIFQDMSANTALHLNNTHS